MCFHQENKIIFINEIWIAQWKKCYWISHYSTWMVFSRNMYDWKLSLIEFDHQQNDFTDESRNLRQSKYLEKKEISKKTVD